MSQRFVRSKSLVIQIISIIVLVGFVALPALAATEAQLRNKNSALNSKVENGEDQLDDLHGEVESLQARVAALNKEIDELNEAINKTSADIHKTEQELIETQAELDRQQGIIDASVRTLYKRGRVSTVELIAGSENFSQFVDQQEYLERVKVAVEEAAAKVKLLKAELEQKQRELSDLKARQEGQKKVVEQKKAEEADLLKIAEGEEAEYKKYVDGLIAAQKKAEKELDAFLAAQNAAGKYVSQGSVKAGSTIAQIGNSGCSVTFNCGPHLHTELRRYGDFFDPVANYGTGQMASPLSRWPVPNTSYNTVSPGQRFGCRAFVTARTNWPGCPPSRPNLHNGLDIAGWYGDPVVAAADGEIIFRGNYGGYGWTVILDHGNGYQTLYAHLLPNS